MSIDHSPECGGLAVSGVFEPESGRGTVPLFLQRSDEAPHKARGRRGRRHVSEKPTPLVYEDTSPYATPVNHNPSGCVLECLLIGRIDFDNKCWV